VPAAQCAGDVAERGASRSRSTPTCTSSQTRFLGQRRRSRRAVSPEYTCRAGRWCDRRRRGSGQLRAGSNGFGGQTEPRAMGRRWRRWASAHGRFTKKTSCCSIRPISTLPGRGGPAISSWGAQGDRTCERPGRRRHPRPSTAPRASAMARGPGLPVPIRLEPDSRPTGRRGNGQRRAVLRIGQTNGPRLAAFSPQSRRDTGTGITVNKPSLGKQTSRDGMEAGVPARTRSNVFTNTNRGIADTPPPRGVLSRPWARFNAPRRPRGAWPTPDPSQPQNSELAVRMDARSASPAGLVTHARNTPNMMCSCRNGVVCPSRLAATAKTRRTRGLAYQRAGAWLVGPAADLERSVFLAETGGRSTSEIVDGNGQNPVNGTRRPNRRRAPSRIQQTSWRCCRNSTRDYTGSVHDAGRRARQTVVTGDSRRPHGLAAETRTAIALVFTPAERWGAG